jgi:hypothetical protein
MTSDEKQREIANAKMCPNGWISKENGICESPGESRCGKIVNFLGFTDEQKQDWAINCGQLWSSVGYSQQCPDSWIPTPTGECLNFFEKCNPLSLKGKTMQNLRDWAARCNNVKWKGVNY